ncbi:hypothetical protein Hanom_Chr11g01036341 [Helianthus anomalus]
MYIDLKDYCDHDEPSKFSLIVFHSGEFTDIPCRSYVCGKYNFIDSADINDFGMDIAEEMVKQLGYSVYMVFYFHYKIPYVCLDLGLKSLSSDSDFTSLFEHVRSGVKLIEIYVEHWTLRVLMTSCGEEVITQRPHGPPPESKMLKCMMLLLLICFSVTTMITEMEMKKMKRTMIFMKKMMMRVLMIRILMKRLGRKLT